MKEQRKNFYLLFILSLIALFSISCKSNENPNEEKHLPLMQAFGMATWMEVEKTS